nr:MAG TPA: hypothetical protein [Caudoviricetes sp.]
MAHMGRCWIQSRHLSLGSIPKRPNSISGATYRVTSERCM